MPQGSQSLRARFAPHPRGATACPHTPVEPLRAPTPLQTHCDANQLHKKYRSYLGFIKCIISQIVSVLFYFSPIGVWGREAAPRGVWGHEVAPHQ